MNPQSSRLFKIISWSITGLIVAALLGIAGRQFIAPQRSVTPAATQTDGTQTIPTVTTGAEDGNTTWIARRVDLSTIAPTRQPYDVTDYSVSRGESLYGIANDFNIKPETLYWANFDVFNGSPDSLKPGDMLRIPPTDGVYYKWQEGDTFESVAKEFDVDPETIINWPGNNIDLTDPQVKEGTYVMVPGGKKDDQPLFITTVSRGNTAKGLACGGGFAARGYFTWPTVLHSLSGYDWGENGHKGIDISAVTDSPILAAESGVVTMASYGWNNGYGNVVQIDHGNGFVTVYGHLNSINVQECQSVSAGAIIGAAGSTGNSSGTHLHFEIRFNGVPQNPWFYLP